jgi:hypothetical protein
MRTSSKAIIRFSDGTEATYDEDDHRWHASDPELARQLDIATERLPHDYHPNPAAGIARAIAAEIGAEVIHTDPAPGRDVPGAAY